MAHSVQNRRGPKSGLPELRDAEFGLTTDTKELFVGCGGENLPVLTLKKRTGGPVDISGTVETGSGDLVTGGAVAAAIAQVYARVIANTVEPGACTVVFDGSCKLYNIAYTELAEGKLVAGTAYAAGETAYTLENVAAQSLLCVGVNENSGATVSEGAESLGVLYGTSLAFRIDTADGSTVTITISE